MSTYDAWRLSPPDRGPECAYCGAPGWRVELRLIHAPNPYKIGDDDLCCEECFVGADDGPCFDDCPLPEEYRDDAGDLEVTRRREDGE